MDQDAVDIRFRGVESDIAEIKAAVMSIQSSVSVLQTGFSRDFTPRGETMLAHADLQRQIDENRRRIEGQSENGWKWAAILVSLASASFTLLSWLRPMH